MHCVIVVNHMVRYMFMRFLNADQYGGHKIIFNINPHSLMLPNLLWLYCCRTT